MVTHKRRWPRISLGRVWLGVKNRRQPATWTKSDLLWICHHPIKIYCSQILKLHLMLLFQEYAFEIIIIKRSAQRIKTTESARHLSEIRVVRHYVDYVLTGKPHCLWRVHDGQLSSGDDTVPYTCPGPCHPGFGSETPEALLLYPHKTGTCIWLFITETIIVVSAYPNSLQTPTSTTV